MNPRPRYAERERHRNDAHEKRKRKRVQFRKYAFSAPVMADDSDNGNVCQGG
jgi:hypothetical protein